MPIDDRIVWDEKVKGKQVKVIGTIRCETCANDFTNEIELPLSSTKNEVWKAKEDISHILSQHTHG